MREILFRGKRIDNGEWIEGCLVKVTLGGKTVYLIFGDDFTFDGTDVKALNHALVDPETVGEYTELNANGKMIFEGDIVRIQNDTPFEMTGEVVFDGGCFELHDPECDMYECLWYKPKEMMVLGNIHDNPELLKGEDLRT